MARIDEYVDDGQSPTFRVATKNTMKIADGDPVIEVAAAELDEDAPFEYDEDEPNLVEVFAAHPKGKACLKKVADRVKREFKSDFEASESYRERFADDWRLFTCDLPKKDYPFENASNPHVPMTFENITRQAFRAAGELFGDWTNVFGVTPMGPDDQTIAELLSKHGNWQIRNQITDFRRQMHRAILLFFMTGDVTTHSYWDPVRKRNRHDVLTCDEFITPYVYITTEPDYSDLPHYHKIINYQKHELQAMRDVWYGVQDVIDDEPPAWDDEPEQRLREIVGEVQGQEPADSGAGTYKIIWYEGWLTLPNQDRERFCKVIWDHRSGSILSLSIHEEVKWQEKHRFERQLAEKQAWLAAMQEHQNTMMQAQTAEQQLLAQLSSPMVDPQEAAMMQQALAEPMPPQPPPPPPKWMEEAGGGDFEAMMALEPKPPAKEPIRMFSHGVNVEPLVGALGLGNGRVQADLNRAANVALSQLTDSAHLANSWSVITTLDFDTPFKIAPGKINKVTGASADDLRKNFVDLKPDPANPQLFQIVDLCWNWGQSSIQSPNVLSGEAGKSGETYRGIAARIEQATKQLSVSTRKFADMVENVLKNNGRLNAIYMDEEEIFYLNDHRLGLQEEVRVGRKLYERDYRVEVRSDLRFASTAQKVAEADEALQLPQAVPPLQGNLAYWYMAVKKALEARGQYDLVQALGPPPPPPTAPFGIQPMMPPGPPGAPPGPPGAPPGNPTAEATVGPPTGAGGPAPGQPPPAPAPPPPQG